MGILSEFEIWMFLAGLGIFLFGMHMMEESIRVLSGAAFKSMIRRYTGTRPKAILGGAVSTAVLQSSSAVSLMVLAFVGAGIMNLVQAISVMMGSKIGTTATAWIVAIFGFKFDIDAFSLPLIGIGGLGIILLAKSPKYVNISRFLVAFGFLFMGLDYMKSSVDQFSEAIDPSIFEGYGIILFAIAGMVLTAIMQSSSATIAIVLSMLFSGVILFDAAAAMVVGANVGTTVTVLLGSIGGNFTKKQAAVSQLIFTVGTAIATLILLPVLIWFVLSFLGFDDNLVIGLAFFHTLFNLLGVLLFYPFIPMLANKVEEIISEKEIKLSTYIHNTNPEIVDAGIEAFRKEIICQLQLTLKYVDQLINPKKSKDSISYVELETYHADIFEYYGKLHQYEMKEDENIMLDKFLRASRNFMNVAMNIKDAQIELQTVKSEDDQTHKNAYQSLMNRLYMCIESGQVFENLNNQEVRSAALNTISDLLVDINRMDREYILMCGEAARNKSLRKVEVTLLLMLNRLITQSGRMLAHGMKSILEHETTDENQVA